MVGTYLPWLGAWILASQAAGGRAVSPLRAVALTLACTAVMGVLAVVIHVPDAGWNLGTFGVAVLPGLALATAIAALGARRQ
jgi:hypothetical protein